MAVTTYTVKRGDSLWRIASNYGSSISGSNINAKIDTLVRLNGIKNRNLIYVGQVLKLSEYTSSGSSSSPSPSSASAPAAPTSVTFNGFGLQAEDTSGRAMYVTWSWSRANTANYKVRWRYYADGYWWIGSETTTTSYESEYCQSTYSAPSNAKKVRVSVKPISTTYKDSNNNDVNYWTLGYSAEKEYDFANNPPSPPSGSINVKIDGLTLTASIENLDLTELNATAIYFDIVKDNSTSVNKGYATIQSAANYVSYQCQVEAGGDYKVRCRAERGSLTSGWTDFTSSVGTKPSAPTGITIIKANAYSDSEISVYLEWPEVNHATAYDVEYADSINKFDKPEKEA